MVDQLNFAGGKMHGQFVDASGNLRGFAALYSRRESREVALARGISNLERVAARLTMSPSTVESSKRLYNLALQRNFTLGRNNYFVVAACLYAVCRREKESLMLIDFSDALTTPVKTLAQVFMKLVRALSLSVTAIDPSLFLERFAGELQLKSEVAATGVRLVQAMQRDWLVTGRRPLGLCAASLLIAARYHKIRINAEDIQSTFRISESTIMKRVTEFQSTATAAVPVKDFEATDLLQLEGKKLPPCAIKRPRNTGLFALEAGDQDGWGEGDLPRTASKLRAIEAGERALPIEDEAPLPDGDISNLAGKISLSSQDREKACHNDLSSSEVSSLAKNMTLAISETYNSAGVSAGAESSAGDRPQLTELIREVSERASEIVADLEPAAGGDAPPVASPASSPEPCTSLALIEEIDAPLEAEEGAIVPVAVGEEDDESLSDVDVSEYMLGEEEKHAKALIWDELTKDVMARVYERQRERKLREASAGTGSMRQRKSELPSMDNPAEAAKAALQRASTLFKHKMNEEAVNDLFSWTDDVPSATPMPSSAA